MSILKQLQDMNGHQDYDPNIIHHFGGGVYANLPPYLALAFIMKL